MTFDDLTRIMLDSDLVAVNIHRDGAGFRVHVRRSQDEGFHVAQKTHDDVAGALLEHFPAAHDEDLLI